MDAMYAFNPCFDQDRRGVAPEEYTSMPQWQKMMKQTRDKRIQVVAREFDESGDAEFARMRMVAIWEAQDTMERRVEERSYATLFFT
jgi:hypothetical protein